ncbi:MAG: adenylate/guanylate cyclase domain-containing protein [Chloroflexi bacterium]|nr:adenylate/guanylate cyclase domain-containing protein [Chloroflexota bacterium]MCA2001568.1 adenylate/guanylate cyclase domain-containing protein [Chloroflexota bacterium]
MINKSRPILSLRLILLLGTTLVVVLLQTLALLPNVTTPLERIEYSARDMLTRLRGKQETSNNVVIVAIDDFSFNWTGSQWPWPRSYLAAIVEQINQGGGRVVGLDIFLFEPDPEDGNDEALAAALENAPAAVSVEQISNERVDGFAVSALSRPLPVYLEALDGIGVTAFARDEDAVVRGVRAYETYRQKDYFHWAFEAARLYLKTDSPTKTADGKILFNGQVVPTSRGQILINFAGPAKSFPTYSAADVHDGVVLEENPDAFREKIVLIGATTVTLQDVYPTPFSAQVPMPGVEIVANAIETLVSGTYLREAPPWLEILVTLLAAPLAFIIVSRSKQPSLTLTLLAAAMLGYAVFVFVSFLRFRYLLPFISPQLTLFLGVVLPTLEQAVSQELEKRRVRNLFSRFISPEMVDQMMSARDLSALNKRADLSVLFSDIRGFTTLSEKLTPEEVVALLNPYLEAMSKEIYKHGGTVDKYEGDAIIAFFGEPIPFKDHAARSLRAALDMRKALDKLKKQWAAEGRPTQIEMGIGINSGEVFVGLLGSEQRINYTVIGDNANLASRLQDLTKTYAWPILISESVYQQVKEEFDAEFADAVTVKGKTKPVNVYKVIGRKGAPETERIQGWKK